jgi:hypothetical protein
MCKCASALSDACFGTFKVKLRLAADPAWILPTGITSQHLRHDFASVLLRAGSPLGAPS